MSEHNLYMDTVEATVQVNSFARRERHLKVFSKRNLTRLRVKTFFSWIAKPITSFIETPFVSAIWRFYLNSKSSFKAVSPDSPQKKLLAQTAVLSIAALISSSFTVAGSFTHASMDYSSDYIEAYSLPGDILVADDSGYIVKINPQTDQSNRVGLTDYAIHTVESGETLSVIAERYGISTKTVMWENNISNANTLRIGQSLLIPPVDGLGYKVNSGDTLEKIAEKYKIEVDAIVAQNVIEGNVIQKGQQLFLPGAAPIVAPVNVANTYRNVNTYSNVRIDAPASNASPAVGKIFIFPTRGGVTQGYSGGHRALDIADRSKPPIWAAAGGVVEKVSTGTWGGGYGNHVIINHGNGVKTLYAHMDSVGVYAGQDISQGDVLGIMGNTGRVYGATGIHVHWEVIINGVRQNPYNYF